MGRFLRLMMFDILSAVSDRMDRRARRRAKLTEDDYYAAVRGLSEGFVLLTRTSGRPINLLIPGHYKHAVMFTGTGVVVEATPPSVRERGLIDLMLEVDEFCILKPRLDSAKLLDAVEHMREIIGEPYDFGFTDDLTAFYCSEAIHYALNAASGGEFGSRFVKRKILGVESIVPDDMRKATQAFEVVYDSREA